MVNIRWRIAIPSRRLSFRPEAEEPALRAVEWAGVEKSGREQKTHPVRRQMSRLRCAEFTLSGVEGLDTTKRVSEDLANAA